MRYVSTRGDAPPLDFEDVLLTGLAADGGLYVPETLPSSLTPDEIEALAGLPYAETAVRVMAPFLGGALLPEAFAGMVEDTYRDFAHPAVAPLKQLGPREWLLELFHGPTLAFKDFALQLLGRLFDHALARRGERITIVGATSGDTGSAAIAGCQGRERMQIFILHPHGRISEVQRRQMTAVLADNVHNLAIEGTFDDCQALVKSLFADAALRRELNLAAVNSINWARIMAQTVYYFYAAVALGAPHRAVAFAVPTGNFGDVYAGYLAARIGLPVERLIVATNRNDILARFFATGEYRVEAVRPSLSPSMDIQVASNFERLLYDLFDRDGRRVAGLMHGLAETRALRVDGERLGRARARFAAARVDDEATRETIAAVRRETGELLDPHTAIGVRAARESAWERRTPTVALATAHPAKFPDPVAEASGVRPPLPAHLADLCERPERYDVLPPDLGAIKTYLRDKGRGFITP